MKRILLCLLALFFLNSTAKSSCSESVLTFYREYIQNIMNDNSKNAALCEKYLSPELRLKLERQVQATDADVVIRAQDANQEMLETLKIEELPNEWYIISFRSSKDQPENLTEIPLRAHIADGKCTIYYIAPDGCGRKDIKADGNYGVAEKTTVNQQSEREFISSFIKSYASLYCRMSEDLYRQLKELRSKHLTANALKQYREAELESEEDNSDGYDLLIDNYDFDPMWMSSLQIKAAAAPHQYKIIYSAGGQTSTIDMTVIKNNSKYLIDSIQIDEGN